MLGCWKLCDSAGNLQARIFTLVWHFVVFIFSSFLKKLASFGVVRVFVFVPSFFWRNGICLCFSWLIIRRSDTYRLCPDALISINNGPQTQFNLLFWFQTSKRRCRHFGQRFRKTTQVWADVANNSVRTNRYLASSVCVRSSDCCVWCIFLLETFPNCWILIRKWNCACQ